MNYTEFMLCALAWNFNGITLYTYIALIYNGLVNWYNGDRMCDDAIISTILKTFISNYIFNIVVNYFQILL